MGSCYGLQAMKSIARRIIDLGPTTSMKTPDNLSQAETGDSTIRFFGFGG
jgi:hypothetical protein